MHRFQRGHHKKQLKRHLLLLFLDNLAVVLGILTLQNKHRKAYIVGKFQIHMHWLRTRTENLTKGPLFYLFLKLVRIIFLFSYNVCILSIYYFSSVWYQFLIIKKNLNYYENEHKIPLSTIFQLYSKTFLNWTPLGLPNCSV